MSRTRDVERLFQAIATAGLLRQYSAPTELHPAHLPVALVHAVHDVPPACEDKAAVHAERYATSFGLKRVRHDRRGLPPRHSQHTLNELVERFECVGLTRMEAILDSCSDFPGTDFSRPTYVLAAARELRHLGIEVLQDVHEMGWETVATACERLPSDARGVARRLLTYTGNDDWVLADEPVVAFVQAATGNAEISSRRTRTLVREAANELLVAPRNLDLRVWREARCAQVHQD